MNIFDSRDYKRSKAAYISQATIEYFITLLLSAISFVVLVITVIYMSKTLLKNESK